MVSTVRVRNHLSPIAADPQITTPSVFAESIGRQKQARAGSHHPCRTRAKAGRCEGAAGIRNQNTAKCQGWILHCRGARIPWPRKHSKRIHFIVRVHPIFAATLQQSDPAYRQWISEHTGIAHCIGFASNDDTDKLHLLFSTNSRAKSVNSFVHFSFGLERKAPRPIYTLNEKLELARMVATAVLNTHNYRYVHKNIRPSNILCVTEFKDGESQSNAQRASLPYELGRALLVGYSDARESSAGTERLGPQHVGEEIYIHRSRGNEDAELNARHTFLHDVLQPWRLFA